MKIIKKILIFAVFTGIIFGIFTFVTKQEVVVNTAALSATNHDQLRSDISREWSELKDWDEEIYNHQLTMIAQSENAGVIDEIDSKTLRNLINETASKKCVAAMDREFARANCDEEKLAHNYAGLQSIIMNEKSYAKKPQIVEVSNVYSLYQRIVSFNNRSFALSPRFNNVTDSWASWSSHQDRINNQKNELISNPIFQSRLSAITKVKEIYNTENKLQTARSTFYNRLGDEICSYYDMALSQLQPTGEGNEAFINDEKAKLSIRVSNIRVNLAYEKYLYSGHEIFGRMSYLNKKCQ